MNVKLPNFLIVGAAKSGTTSLYHYLKQHPEIYMSPVKEPKFITSNFLKFPFRGIGDEEVEQKIVKSFTDYCQLFKDVKDEKALGEASADNLYYYEQSISYIKKHLSNPKIIIVLRNPVERAYSAYLHLLRDKRESLSFETALKEEEMRKKQNWEFIWFYKDVGFYHNQVKAYIDNFSHIKIILYDDFRDNSLNVLREIFSFLNVTETFQPSCINEKFNVSGIPKSNLLHNFLTRSNPVKSAIRPFIKAILPSDTKRKFQNRLIQMNLVKSYMKPETRKYLINLFREDILKLQDLIKRDLSHWLE